MHVAKIIRSGTTVSIELPAGFEIGEGDLEVRQDGDVISLRPIAPSIDEWAWLAKFEEPVPQELVQAMDEMDCAIAEFDAHDRLTDQRPPRE